MLAFCSLCVNHLRGLGTFESQKNRFFNFHIIWCEICVYIFCTSQNIENSKIWVGIWGNIENKAEKPKFYKFIIHKKFNIIALKMQHKIFSNRNQGLFEKTVVGNRSNWINFSWSPTTVFIIEKIFSDIKVLNTILSILCWKFQNFFLGPSRN